MIRAVLWDFGGVILSSPFEAFNRYEAANGLPADFIRSVNATNPDTNAWALLERNDVTPAEFDKYVYVPDFNVVLNNQDAWAKRWEDEIAPLI